MSQSGTIYSQGRLCSDWASLSDDTRVAMAWVPLGETDIVNSSAFYGSAPAGRPLSHGAVNGGFGGLGLDPARGPSPDPTASTEPWVIDRYFCLTRKDLQEASEFTASFGSLRSSKEGKWLFREDDTNVIEYERGQFEDGATGCCVDLQFNWDQLK